MNTCAWCNRSVDDHKTIWIRKNLLIGYPFCSNKCSSSWKKTKNDEQTQESKQNNDSNSSDDNYVSVFGSIKENLEVSRESSKTFEDVLAEARMFGVQHQIEMEKQAAIDKSNQDFFDSIKRNWKIIIAGVIVAVIGVGVFIHFNNLSKQNDIKLSQQLEKIEDKVRLSIQSGDKEKALDLTNQLIHPSHKDMETQKFDTWHGYPKFDEYWTKKREKYKEEIMKLSR